jgi:hypothetical protein
MWGDERFVALSRPKPNAQTLWVFLLTGPQTTAAPGLFSAGEAALAEALDWPLPAFRKCFQEIAAREMAKADWRARVVWIPKAVLYNPAENQNTVKAWRKAIAEIPECALRDEAEVALKAASGFPEVFELGIEEDERGRLRFGSAKPPRNPSGSDSETDSGSGSGDKSGNDSTNGSWNGSGIEAGISSRRRSRNQEQEQEQEQEEEGSGTPAAAGAARAPSPRKLLETWNANRGHLPEAKALPPGREKAARARLRAVPDLERWAHAVRHLASLPHLTGKDWVTIDFLVRPDSLTKVEEGRYDRPFRDSAPPAALVGAHPPEPRPRRTTAAPEVVLDPPPPGGGVWPRVLEALRPRVDERDFDTWFRPTRQVGELNGVLRVAVAPLFRRYVPAEYDGAIESACRACGVTVPVEYLTDEAGGEA